MAEMTPPEVALEETSSRREFNDHGRFYWFAHNVGERCAAFFKRHALLFILIALGVAFAVFSLRAPLHPTIIEVRKRLALVVVGALLTWEVVRFYRQGGVRRRVFLALFLVVFIPTLAGWGDNVHDYLTLGIRYLTLPRVELDTLPVTDHERTHPLKSIYNFARRAISDNEQPTLPRIVRNHRGEYEWTLGVEPSYAGYQVFGNVTQVLAVSATTPSPRFTPENHHRVNFVTGEKMRLGSNTYTATVRAFGPWRYLNDEPSDLIYLQDDDGAYVQAVSIIRWRGIFFPRPEFGGVQIIRQQPPTVGSFIKKMFIGVGEWIPAEEILKHRFLAGQNVVPYQVMRFAAESFRFQNGPQAPLPGIHDGDVRIPDQEADENPQPFVCHFNIPPSPKLYGFFSLEPYNPSQQGLNTAVFYPGDGQGPVYYYRPQKHDLAIMGVSGVNALVRESKKAYTWQISHPAENRPYIKLIDGAIRFSWLSTVVTEADEKSQSKGAERDFVSGSTPEIVLTDGVYSVPVWVTSLDPSTWPNELKAKMAPLWGKAPRAQK